MNTDSKNTENEQCTIPSVSIMLPKLVTEDHKMEWLAYLDGIKGMVCSGKTETEAIDQLMISVKVKLLYDRGN